MNAAELEKLCPGCMHELRPGEDVCPNCGWLRKGKNAPGQLPVGALLGGKYYIGAAVRSDKEGVTYMAWDIPDGKRLEVTEFFPRASAVRGEDGYSVSTMTQAKTALDYLKAVPGGKEIFRENGTAYITSPVDQEQEKKRLEVWGREKEREREKARAQEEKWKIAELDLANEARQSRKRRLLLWMIPVILLAVAIVCYLMASR